MNKTICSIPFFLLLALNPLPVAAEEALKVSFGNALHPWMMPETDEGIAVNIFKTAMAETGRRVETLYVPFHRRIIAYNEGLTDVAAIVTERDVKANGMEGYLSDVAAVFENGFFALKKNGYKIDTIMDARERSVVAWQGAKVMLAGDFAKMADACVGYREIADQLTQVRLLFSGRADLVAMDRNIFNYYRREVDKDKRFDARQPVDLFPLGGRNETGFLFRDKALCEIFNANLKKMKENGEYQKIIDHYTKMDVALND